MTATRPQIISTFVHKTGSVKVRWYDIDSEIPDLPWQQVYIVGDIDGKVPIVHYGGEDRDNLPGGKTEPGETIDETIHREALEELNCSVESWVPLGYQECTQEDGRVLYQLRVAARLTALGPFKNDPGGAVIGYSLVSLESLNEHIGYGEIGDRLVELGQGRGFGQN